MKIPAGYQTVMPYLIVAGAEKLIDFTQAVFEAKVTHRTMRDEEKNIIMHAEIMIGDSTIMFADATEQYAPQTAGMFVYVEDADEAYQKALDAGAVSVLEPADQSYGRSCGVTDPLGNTWWITSEK
ncbi:VOC family protein [Compostibacter hankyongensis]